MMTRAGIHKVLLTDLFDEWELRVCILLSLYLQIFLIVAGTFRRLASHKWIVVLVWLAYLLAEIIAVFGLGLIVSRQSLYSKYCNNDKPDYCYDDHIHIYWASFLLVHIGGPDTITAFAPEDNELWLRHLLHFVKNYNYDDILLLWHIATDLCYNDDQDQVTNKDQRNTAKQLSDYMLYLMVMKPHMMSAVSGIGQIKFQNICREVSELFDTEEPLQLRRRKFCFFNRRSQENDPLLTKACERILNFNKESQLVTVKRDRNILFTASVLAKELKMLPSEEKWLIISKLWVELLSFAAINIRSSAHAIQLSKGGELITIVWFLMAHFGLGDEYEINSETQEPELTVERVRPLSI